MTKHLLILLPLMFVLHFSANAQRKSRSQPYWSTHVLLSSSSLLSDLGGKNYFGSNDVEDLNLRKTRYAIGSGIQYNLPNGFSFGLDAFYTRLAADDAETDWDRKYRQIKVRTDVLETALKIEYTIPRNAGILGGFYANVGGGVFFYQPMSEINGVWYKLRPLGTEGQLVDPEQSPYAIYSAVIPFGFGKKIYLQNGMILGIDLSLRKSFTDYLDDVSGTYYDREAIRANTGEAAAYFSNPAYANGENKVGTPGSIRGNSSVNDTYFLFGFKLHIPLGQNGGGNFNTSCSYNSNWLGSDGRIPKIRKKGKKRRIRIFR